MQEIINLIILVLLTLWILLIYFRQSEQMRTINFPYKENTKYVLSKNLYFLILTVCTAPVFLPSFSFVKYFIWLAVLVLLILNGNIRLKFGAIVLSYLLFILWVCTSTLYTNVQSTAQIANSIVRFAFPLLFLWLGYNAIDSKYSFLIFSRTVCKTTLFYIFWIGGIAAVFLPFIYYSPVGNGIFLTYAGFADYLTSLFPIPFIMFFLTKRKLYLGLAGLMVLSSVLETVRTGMGGMFIGSILILICLYKVKSLPYISTVIIIAVTILVAVPSVRKKMFYEKEVNAEQIITGELMGSEDIKDSGRFETWELALKRFYEPHKLTGSGVGVASEWLKVRSVQHKGAALLHNDYVLIMCETGLIGLSLFILFSVIVLVTCIYSIFVNNKHFWVSIMAGLTIASFGGVLFSMGFDNIYSHSMTSIVNPFIFMGFFLKMKDIYAEKEE